MAPVLPRRLPPHLAHRLADVAGNAIRPYFRGVFDVVGKPDKPPVTAANRAAERTGCGTVLAEAAPSHGVIGEEFGRDRDDAELVWTLNPIDGTKAFITGRPLFVTLIALLHRGEPVLGVVDQQNVGNGWTGAIGEPTLHNGKPVRARRCATLAEARLSTTGPPYFTAQEFAAFNRVAARAPSRRTAATATNMASSRAAASTS